MSPGDVMSEIKKWAVCVNLSKAVQQPKQDVTQPFRGPRRGQDA